MDEQAPADSRDLWDPPHRYVLVRVGLGADDLPIFDPVTRQAKLICEDDELEALVIRHMLVAGV
jgi:hypothetical protein